MIEINGNYGEGGGQIIRTSLAISCLTNKAFKAYDIRKGRKQAGLKAQHLYSIKALEELCNAKTENNSLGSENLSFQPGKIKGQTISINIGTAGSISLLLQAVLMPSFFADDKVRLRITGGTSGKWAMPWDYFTQIYLPIIKRYCKSIDCELVRRGYYPKGQGKVDINIQPRHKLSEFVDFQEFRQYVKENTEPIELIETGKLVSIEGISHASNLLQKAKVSERQAKAAKQELTKLNFPVKINTEYADTACPGSGIVLWANYENTRLGTDNLGERGKRAEIVGKQAAQSLLQELNKGAADKHLADNLIPWLIFGGKIKTTEITNHTKTNIWVVEQFLGKIFNVKENTISQD